MFFFRMYAHSARFPLKGNISRLFQKMKRSADHSAAQPVETKVCIITYDVPMHNVLTKSDPQLDILLSVKTAVQQDPDLIVVCLGQMGTSAQMTSDLMRVLHKELETLQRKGEARPLVDQKFTTGVLCFFFTQPELKDEFDPEKGGPRSPLRGGFFGSGGSFVANITDACGT